MKYRSVFLCGMYAALSIHAQNPKEIMQNVNLQNSPIDEQIDFRMKLIDSKGRIRERTATQYSKRVTPTRWESSRLIRFHSPAEMAKSAVLIIEKEDADNQQWIYLPATYSTRRIPSKNRGDRYMGTDFSYEDVSSIQIDKYKFNLVGSRVLDGQDCHQIEQISKDIKLSEESLYGKIIQYVDKSKHVILEAEYFDKKNILIKRLKATKFIKEGEYFRSNHIEMEDMRLNHKTVIDYEKRTIGKGLNEHLFSIQSLERGN